ncbi:fimbria/pilus outer membrane usher protein [Pantoea ananatis]|uniref:fimbria/pilus outer membrane usher protein n=1 Tax=Pantoea ananas TaxID=553 RepID=UPI0032EFBBB1
MVIASAMLSMCSGHLLAANNLTEGSVGVTDTDEPAEFESEFLSLPDDKAKNSVNLKWFSRRGGMMPGRYRVQVKINEQIVANDETLTFRSYPEQPGRLYACLNAQKLDSWGVVVGSDSYKKNGKAEQDTGCPIGGITALVPWAAESFDFNNQILNLTVPQASLSQRARLRTQPSTWDYGMPAILMNYSYSGSQTRQGRSDFLGLNGQLNLLGWRLRSGLNLSRASQGAAVLNTQDIYAVHDYAQLGGGQFSVGKLSSGGVTGESVPFTGVMIASDEGMRQTESKGYRPAITGIADSPATVTVYQYGKAIYQKNVPAGPFSLSDFNHSGSGDVDVEVREADGRVRRFTMSDTPAINLMRRGEIAYSIAAGKMETYIRQAISPAFIQGSVSAGVGDNRSVQAGTLLSPNYQSVTIGSSVYSPLLGAFSLNTSASVMQAKKPGISYKFNWARNIGSLGISFSTAQYLLRSFYSYSEAQNRSRYEEGTESQGLRASYQLSVSLPAGSVGSFSLSGNRTEYDGQGGNIHSLVASWNRTFYDIGLSVSASYGHARNGKKDSQLYLMVSLPIGKWLGGGASRINYNASRSNGRIRHMSGYTDSAGNMSWGVSQDLSNTQNRALNLGYTGSLVSVGAGYSTGYDSESLSYNLNGGMVLHPGGVTLSPTLSMESANALVEIPGAPGVNVGTGSTDWWGRTVVGLTPYERNQVNVDMSDLPGNIDLDKTSKNIIPARGALVPLRFAALKGYRVLFTLNREKNAPVPFGAMVTLRSKDESMPISGIVGEDGQVYISGLPEKGHLTVQWGEEKSRQCEAYYALPSKSESTQLQQIKTVCS